MPLKLSHRLPYFPVYLPVIVLMLCITATGVQAQTYKIKLARASKAGDQYNTKVSATVKQVLETTAAGKTTKSTEEFTAELTGVITIKAVNSATGEPTELSCKVEKLTRDGKELFPAGTVIVAQKTGHLETFTVNDVPDTKNTMLLAAVLETTDPAKTLSDDDFGGTIDEQKVGATWPVNSANIAIDLKTEGIPIKADQVKGESRLVRVDKLGNTGTMEVSTVFSVDSFSDTLGNGTSITDGKLRCESTDMLPVDSTLPKTAAEQKFSLGMTFVFPNNAGKQVVSIERIIKMQRELIKP